MDAKAVVAAVLGAINDHTQVHLYGDGLLVDLPLTYGDGDAVRILVEPMGDGMRVSDRATAASMLAMAGVDYTSGKAAAGFSDAVRRAGLNAIGAAGGEVATFGATNDLGRMVLAVAQASMRAEQLRWLAHQRPEVTFADQVAARVKGWAGQRRQVERDSAIQLSSGRARHVTVAVSGSGKTAYIQAVSTSERDRSTERCYFLFGNADRVPKDHKIAALAGLPDQWPAEHIAELSTVSAVEFFGELTRLERKLDEVLPASQPRLKA